MKKIIYVLVVMFFIATFFIIGNRKDNKNYSDNNDIDNTNINFVDNEEIRAIFLSYIEINKYIKDNSLSKTNIDLIIENLSNDGFNLVLLHTRSFSDSIYSSKIFPNYLDLDYDVLDYFINKSHAKNIKVHAWVNPYRISNDKNFVIEESHPAYKFIDTNGVKRLDNGVYYNPSNLDVTDLIVEGIKEIVSNYDVDGVIFDDYFYPSNDIDNEDYLLYKESGGNLSISEYRLNNISNMIERVYSSIKSINSNVLFGISPQGNIENNYKSEFLDVKKILRENGYIDYIMPQIYFGFENSNKPFIDTVNEWNDLIFNDNVIIILALSLYKSGNIDNYAGTGKNEWVEKNDIIKRQIIYSRSLSKYKGFALFRYDHFYNSNISNMNLEVSNIKKIIKKNS